MAQHIKQPNTRLKYERDHRGWSRDYVAEQLGSDPKTIARWERGITSPNAFYRQRLCELFQCDAETLGLMPQSQYTAYNTLSSDSITDDPPLIIPLAVDKHKAFLQRMRIGGIVCTIALICMGTSLGAWRLFFSHPLPGGVWVRPWNGEVVQNRLSFAAYAYPTTAGDPPIAHVNFTIRLNSWEIACIALPPASPESLFTCQVSLQRPGAVSGLLVVSFDVYDTHGDFNKAPNGEVKILYSP